MNTKIYLKISTIKIKLLKITLISTIKIRERNNCVFVLKYLVFSKEKIVGKSHIRK